MFCYLLNFFSGQRKRPVLLFHLKPVLPDLAITINNIFGGGKFP